MVEPLTAGMPPTFRARGRKVFVVNKRPENLSDRHGYQVDFALANEADMPEDIVIYQNVKVKIETINSEGETDDMNYEFTEAWKYDPDRQITDSFLVPIDWRVDQKGFMQVKSEVWAEEGKIHRSLKKGKGRQFWGNLHGSFNLLPPKGRVTYRNETIIWDNLGKESDDTFVNGKDLTYDMEIDLT
jgi:hypothetical protein